MPLSTVSTPGNDPAKRNAHEATLDEGRRADGLDAVDALVHFLDYCSVSGVVCTEVRALDEGYLLQTSSASPLRLQGVWRISTDVSSYYVNCKTGEIIRE